MATGAVQGSAIKALQKELRELNETPVEGFTVKIADEGNMFVWDVAIFGPPMTLYEGGYFKAQLFFPPDYPYSPPSMRFISKMFHPNIYENGEVCISILHSPGYDPHSGELPSERWNPTQNVRTILLSVISLLNEPNIHSAAHVDASVSYRKWQESGCREDHYEKTVKSYVELTHADALRDGVVVPKTLEEYCISGRSAGSGPRGPGSSDCRSFLDYDDDEDYCFDAADDDDDDDLAVNEDDVEELPQQSHVEQAPDAGVDSAMEEAEGDVGPTVSHSGRHIGGACGVNMTKKHNVSSERPAYACVENPNRSTDLPAAQSICSNIASTGGSSGGDRSDAR